MPIFVVRIDENISAIHERRVNIADADVVTLASNPQDALAAHRDERRCGTVAAKMTSLKNKCEKNVQQTKSEGCRKKERPANFVTSPAGERGAKRWVAFKVEWRKLIVRSPCSASLQNHDFAGRPLHWV